MYWGPVFTGSLDLIADHRFRTERPANPLRITSIPSRSPVKLGNCRGGFCGKRSDSPLGRELESLAVSAEVAVPPFRQVLRCDPLMFGEMLYAPQLTVFNRSVRCAVATFRSHLLV